MRSVDDMEMAIDPQLMGDAVYSEEEEEQTGYEVTNLGYNPQLGGEAHDYDAQLDHDRRQQRRKLHSRMEQIFAKYGKDFEGIGDEIDLETGMIVVDNGHLENMLHEADAGDGDALEEPIVAAVTLGQDCDDGTSVDSDNDTSDEGDEGDDSDYQEHQANTPPENILEQMPSLRESVLSLQSRQRRGQGIDQDAIEALGMSIAKQLTDLMSQTARTGSKRKQTSSKDEVWAYPDVPRPPPEKRQRQSLSPLPDWPAPSPGRKSLWAPLRIPKQRKKRGTDEPAESTTIIETTAVARPEDSNIIPEDQLEPQSVRKCSHCSSSGSVIWRRGPTGMMCNACGMYWYRYGLLRKIGSQLESEESSPESSDDEIEEEYVESEYSANTSRRRDQLPQRNHNFQSEEDIVILRLKEIERLSWERIAKHLPARTAYAVQCRYSKKLHNRPVEARAALANQGYDFQHDENGLIVFTPAPPPTGFTDEEDELLLKLREEDKLDWDRIAVSFPTRTPKALELRFNQLAKKILAKYRGLSGKKPKKRNPAQRLNMRYSEEEDELLKKLREVDKLSWAELAERFPGRNAMSLQKRYVRDVSDAARARQQQSRLVLGGEGEDLKHTRYTFEEDELLLRLREQDGLSWEEIEQRMPGRLKGSIENRYGYIYARKQKGVEEQAETSREDTVDGTVDQPEGAADTDGAQSDDELMSDGVDGESSMLTYPEVARQVDVAALEGVTRMSVEQMPTEDDPSATIDDSPQLTLDEPPSHMPAPSMLSSVLDPTLYQEPATVTGQQQTTKQRWTSEENDLLQKLRSDGLDWDAIALQLPGRSAKAIQSHYSITFGPKVLQRKSLELANQQSKNGNALLRKAIDNNARRRSLDTNVAEVGEQGNASDSGAGDDAVVPPEQNQDDLLRGEGLKSVKELLPSALPQEQEPSASAVKEQTRTVKGRSALDGPPKVPAIFREVGTKMLSNSPGPSVHQPPPPTRIERPTRVTRSPAPDTAVSLTYGDDFVTSEASRPATREGEEHRAISPTTPFLGYSRSSPQPTGQTPLLTANYFTPARYSAQTHPYFIVPPASMYIPGTAHEHDGLENATHHDDHDEPDSRDKEVIQFEVEAVKKRKLNSIKQRSSNRAKGHTQPAKSTVRDVFDLPASSDAPANNVQEEAHAAQVQLQADLASTLPTPDEQQATNKIKTAEPGSHELFEHVHTALKSQHPMPMSNEEIRDWLMAHYTYFRMNPNGRWRDRVRQTLYKRKEFVKNSNRHGAPWVLVDSVDEANEVDENEDDENDVDEDEDDHEGNSGGIAQVYGHGDGEDGLRRSSRRPPVLADISPDHELSGNDSKTTITASDEHEADLAFDDSLIVADDFPSALSHLSPHMSGEQDEDELSAHMSVLADSSFNSSRSTKSSPRTLNVPTKQEAPFLASTQHINSDITREPESSTPAHNTRSHVGVPDSQSPDSVHSTAAVLSSSSPIMTRRKAAPGIVYGRTSITPDTDYSTLFARPEQKRVHALRSSFGSRASPGYRSSSVGVGGPGSRKRVVYTPMRDGDDSGDELA